MGYLPSPSSRRTLLSYIFHPQPMTPKVHPSCFVAPNAVILGDVEIEKGCGIWFGAVLRGDLSHIHIGAGSNVQDNCVVHNPPGLETRIGKNVSVGHGAVVHGAKIGDDVIIGMNSTLLNDCEIGEGSIVGANALVREAMKVPPGSIVVGVPAKVLRSGDELLRETCRKNAETYHMLRDQHREKRHEMHKSSTEQACGCGAFF